MMPGARSRRMQAKSGWLGRTRWSAPVAAAARSAVVLAALCAVSVASAEIPPVAERKAVTLKKHHAEAERVFAAECGKCHQPPDSAAPADARAGCLKGVPEAKAAQARSFVAAVRAGKVLYEARCGRCHDLIAPGSHDSAYWSKNICTSGECFVENLLEEEEQQVLLYLTSHAKKQ